MRSAMDIKLEEQKEFKKRQSQIMQNGFDNSDNEAYSEEEENLRMDLSDTGSEKSNDEDLLGTQFIDKEDEYPISQKINDLKLEMEIIQQKVNSRKEEGKYIAGRTIDFNQLAKKFEQMAEQLDDKNDYEQEDERDEFMDQLEADPSKAELIVICHSLNSLLLSLKFKRIDLAKAESELKQGQR